MDVGSGCGELLGGRVDGLPGVLLEAGLPLVEVGDVEPGVVGEFEIGPGDGDGDGCSGAGAGRVGGDGGGTTLVAEIVDEDAVLAGGLAHFGEVKGGLFLLHGEGEGVDELLDGGPVVGGVDGEDDVEALAAGCFEEGFEAEGLELRTDVGGAVGERAPGDCGVGVEVDDDAVGVLEVGVGGAPGVDFQDAHLGEGGEGFGGGEGDVGLGLAGFLVGDVDGGDAGREHVVGVLLEEAGPGGAFGAADEGQGAVSDVGQHVGGDGPVILGQLVLGESGVGVEDFFGVGEADRVGEGDGGFGLAFCDGGWTFRGGGV